MAGFPRTGKNVVIGHSSGEMCRSRFPVYFRNDNKGPDRLQKSGVPVSPVNWKDTDCNRSLPQRILSFEATRSIANCPPVSTAFRSGLCLQQRMPLGKCNSPWVKGCLILLFAGLFAIALARQSSLHSALFAGLQVVGVTLDFLDDVLLLDLAFEPAQRILERLAFLYANLSQSVPPPNPPKRLLISYLTSPDQSHTPRDGLSPAPPPPLKPRSPGGFRLDGSILQNRRPGLASRAQTSARGPNSEFNKLRPADGAGGECPTRARTLFL
jgi:hypothetical protein